LSCRSVHCHSYGADASAILVSRVELVDGCNRRCHYCTRFTHRSYFWRDDSVDRVRHAPGKGGKLSDHDRRRIRREAGRYRRWSGWNIIRRVHWPHQDDFEVRCGERFELIKLAVIPSLVGGAADEYCAAVICYDNSVLLQSRQDHLVV